MIKRQLDGRDCRAGRSAGSSAHNGARREGSAPPDEKEVVPVSGAN